MERQSKDDIVTTAVGSKGNNDTSTLSSSTEHKLEKVEAETPTTVPPKYKGDVKTVIMKHDNGTRYVVMTSVCIVRLISGIPTTVASVIAMEIQSENCVRANKETQREAERAKSSNNAKRKRNIPVLPPKPTRTHKRQAGTQFCDSSGK